MKLDISDRLRETLLAPEIEALASTEGRYAQMVAASRKCRRLLQTDPFTIPIANFLVRAVCTVLEEESVAPQLSREVAERARAGRKEALTITELCMQRGIFVKYHTAHNFGPSPFPLDNGPNILGGFGVSIFRDMGWIAGGVARAVKSSCGRICIP